MPEVLIEEGRIATVTLNRPERRNALTVATAAAIAEGLQKVAVDARAIILTGAGSAFCAGGDFDELSRLHDAGAEEAAEHLYSGYQRMIRTVREVEVPVIAAVNGPAMGAGMDLALACDIAVASADAKFGQVWVRLGIIPGTGGAFWTAMRAGWGRASELILTGRVIEASTAFNWGLVNEVVSPDQLQSRSREIAEEIAGNPREAVAANKRALNETVRAGYEQALEHAKKVQPVLFAGEEFRSAINERRKTSL